MEKHRKFNSARSWFIALVVFLGSAFVGVQAQTLSYTKTAKPVVDASGYTHIAVGDIVGPTGVRSQHSMNLSDELTTNLMKKGSHEILDRTVLMQLKRSGSQDAAIVDEGIAASIGEQYQSAVLILGRIQSEKINQVLQKVPQSVVVNGCTTQYFYEATGEFSVQLRVVDTKTAKLIHADAVTVPIEFKSERSCELTGKMDEDVLMRKVIASISEKIINTLLPYEVSETLYFMKPLLANPFKDLNTVVVNFETGNVEKGLETLKRHTTSSETKDKHRYLAFYNLGIGLLANHRFKESLENFVTAYEMNPNDPSCKQMVEFTTKEMNEALVAASE
jgi:hypothetical protein